MEELHERLETCQADHKVEERGGRRQRQNVRVRRTDCSLLQTIGLVRISEFMCFDGRELSKKLTIATTSVFKSAY